MTWVLLILFWPLLVVWPRLMALIVIAPPRKGDIWVSRKDGHRVRVVDVQFEPLADPALEPELVWTVEEIPTPGDFRTIIPVSYVGLPAWRHRMYSRCMRLETRRG